MAHKSTTPFALHPPLAVATLNLVFLGLFLSLPLLVLRLLLARQFLRHLAAWKTIVIGHGGVFVCPMT